MKNFIKSLLPKPILQVKRKILGQSIPRNTPRLNKYQGPLKSVLQCCISYNKYGGYCIPLSSLDRPASQKILYGEVWEPDTIEFMSKHCSTGDVIHAGTYFGDFLPALSRACIPEARVWAFEPNPESYQCAQITSIINNLYNVKIINAGLGSQKGYISLLVTDEVGKSLGGKSKLIESDSNFLNKTIKADILTIDSTIPLDRNISIIQLDVEGFEKSVLTGAMSTIKRCKPILILENLPEKEWLYSNILGLGYEIKGNLHDNTVLINS